MPPLQVLDKKDLSHSVLCVPITPGPARADVFPTVRVIVKRTNSEKSRNPRNLIGIHRVPTP